MNSYATAVIKEKLVKAPRYNKGLSIETIWATGLWIAAIHVQGLYEAADDSRRREALDMDGMFASLVNAEAAQ